MIPHDLQRPHRTPHPVAHRLRAWLRRSGGGALAGAAALALGIGALTAPAAQASALPGDYLQERQWGSAVGAPFTSARGIAVDAAGNVYISDTVNYRVQKFDARGSFVRSWGAFGAGNGQLSQPRGIAVGPDGIVYVADCGNNRVQKFNRDGGYLGQWGGFGTSTGQFKCPYGIATDQDASGAVRVYVTDRDNQRVQRFSSAGLFQKTWGSSGTGNLQFNQPVGIAAFGGNVYVVDYSNNRVQKFSSEGVFRTAWGSAGESYGQFGLPIGISVDASGSVYVADTGNNRIQKFDQWGVLQAVWGEPGSGAGQFTFPYGTAFVGSSVLVLDSENGRVSAFRQAAAPRFTQAPKSSAYKGKTYSSAVKATGFPAVSKYSLVSGKLPKGLKLSATGRITGKPTRPGVYRFTVKAVNGVASGATKTFTITVKKKR